MWDDGWGAGGWLMMSLLMLIFWTLLVAGVIWLVRATRSPPPRSTAGDDARRILDERFARGEISEDEYQARRDALASR
jgi:putative membrane protein